MSDEHKMFTVRRKMHCYDRSGGINLGHPPALKTMDQVRADIALANQKAGCEVMALVPVTK